MTELKLTEPGWQHCAITAGELPAGFEGSGDIYLRGTAYRHDRSLNVDELRAFLPAVFQDSESRHEFLAALGGFYSIVFRTSDRTLAVVDRVRSLPLFHTRIGGRTVLSDSADVLRTAANLDRFDPVRVSEFEHTGYVTGAHTLFEGLAQLQAGECLIERHAGGVTELDRYWRFTHDEAAAQVDSDNFDATLQSALSAVVARCIDYADGRQIILPLSGGYDSRLLATEFTRQKYPNLLAISYGEAGSKELSIARRVAESLGIEWRPVVYSENDWERTATDIERLEFQAYASNWCSLPHLQDWLAMKRLKAENFFQPDCIFVPGHTGDFISGGHVPAAIFTGNRFAVQDLKDLVIQRHYRLRIGMDASSSAIHSDVDSVDWGSPEETLSATDAASLIEEWEWQERQSKYIVNSVRIYDFFGFDWWLPMWDVEFVEHWRQVPLALRREKRRYNQFVMKHYDAHGSSVRQEAHSSSKSRLGKRIASWGARLVSDAMLERIRRERKVIKVKRGFLGFKGRVGELEWQKMLRRGIPINGLNVPLFLEETGHAFLDRDSRS